MAFNDNFGLVPADHDYVRQSPVAAVLLAAADHISDQIHFPRHLGLEYTCGLPWADRLLRRSHHSSHLGNCGAEVGSWAEIGFDLCLVDNPCLWN